MPNRNTVTIQLGKVANTCFVVMPFGGAKDRVYEKVFKPAIREAQLEPVRGDEIFGSRPIMADIWKEIRRCRCVLADLSGKNANVLYELGICHALAKPVIIVTGTLGDVPFDLRGLRCIAYDKEQPDWGALLGHEVSENLTSIVSSPDPADLFQDIEVSAGFPHLEAVVGEPPEAPAANLSGNWQLVWDYHHGRCTGVLHVDQSGEVLAGYAIMNGNDEAWGQFAVKQAISGHMREKSVFLTGTSYQLLQGSLPSYNLDKWEGTLIDDDTVEGDSHDSAGIGGTFSLKRDTSL